MQMKNILKIQFIFAKSLKKGLYYPANYLETKRIKNCNKIEIRKKEQDKFKRKERD